MPGKQRIAILGGGVAGMASAWELTNQPGWQDRYDITLYQLGWRLGGKCASGRGPNGRIEEHGIHVLMGFYDTVFDILQSCYGEMDRPPEAVFATWQEALAKQEKVVLMERFGNPDNYRWLPWEFDFATNSEVPGSCQTGLHPHAVLRDLIRQMLAIQTQSPLFRSRFFPGHRSLIEAAGYRAELKKALLSLRVTNENPQITKEEKQQVCIHLDNYMTHLLALPLARQALKSTGGETVEKPAHVPSTAPQEGFFHWLVDEAKEAVGEVEHFVREVEDEFVDRVLQDVRRVLIQLKIGFAMVHGILTDDVLTPEGWDFAAINDLDLRAWLGRNLACLPGDHLETLDSAPIRGIYDLVFAYNNGVAGQYALEAGTALSFMLRILFGYKGAVYWKMRAGMGDVVLAPMYLTLKQRGVKFQFFHAARRLWLTDAGDAVAAVDIGRQVNFEGEYDPLFEVKGLPCFPSEPLYDRLPLSDTERQTLIALQRDFNGLESPWTTWPDQELIRLEAGQDFDQLIVGISIAAWPRLCPELVDIPRWRDMFDHVKTTATQSTQMWLEPSLSESGWDLGECVLDAYAQPLNSWTDQSDLVRREDWPPEATPGCIAYFTGPLPNQSNPPAPSQHGYARAQHDAAGATFKVWLDANTADLFPRCVVPHTSGLDFNKLVAPSGGNGLARLEDQYWRANVNPSDHYVLSVPGSSKYRLAPGDSGFSNLFLTGDWTLNGMNAGSVEAAAESGVQAAQALLSTI